MAPVTMEAATDRGTERPTRLIRLLREAVRSRPVRTRLATLGVAAISLLVLVVLAAFRGVQTSVESYAGQPSVDLWVAPIGSDTLIRSSGQLPAELATSIRAIGGVAEAEPLVRAFVSAAADEDAHDRSRRRTLLAIGYRLPDGIGGPPALSHGNAPRALREVALDRAAAHHLEISVGDPIWIAGRPARVVGLTRGTNLLATQFLFGDITAAAALSGQLGRASFIAVRLESGADPVEVIRAIRRQTSGVTVHTREEFVANNRREVIAGFLPLLALLSLLGLSVSGVLVALLVQGLVEDRRGDICVLIALGAELRTIALAVLQRIAALVLIATLGGAVLAWSLAWILDRWNPAIPLAFAPGDVAGVCLLFVLAGVGAATAPLTRLRRIDPLEVFRA